MSPFEKATGNDLHYGFGYVYLSNPKNNVTSNGTDIVNDDNVNRKEDFFIGEDIQIYMDGLNNFMSLKEEIQKKKNKKRRKLQIVLFVW